MVAVLFLIGRRLEEPELVDWLLDIEKCPSAPAYAMASDRPLVFLGAAFKYSGSEETGGAGGSANDAGGISSAKQGPIIDFSNYKTERSQT